MIEPRFRFTGAFVGEGLAGVALAAALFGALRLGALGLVVDVLLVVLFGLYSWRNLAGALRVLVFILPVQLALNVAPGIDLASTRVFSLVLGGLWALKELKAGNFTWRTFRLPARPWLMAVLVFFVWAGVSLIGVTPVAAGLRKLAFFVSYVPLPVVALATHGGSVGRWRLAASIGGAGVLAALTAGVPFVISFFIGTSSAAHMWLANVSPAFIGDTVAAAVAQYPSWFVRIGFHNFLRAVGLFPDPHMLAFFLELSLPVTGALALRAARRAPWRAAAWGVGALFELAILGLTFSRGAYVGVAAAVLTLAVLAVWRTAARSRQLLRPVRVGLAAAGVAAIAVIALWHSPISARLTMVADVSTQGRLELWGKAFSMAAARPITGVGLGNFPYMIDPTASYRTPIYAHNTYLDIVSELGVAGLGFWLLFLAGVFRPAVGQFLGIKKTNRLPALAVVLSFTAFAAHGLFDTPLFSPAVLPLLLVLPALLKKAT